MLGLIKDKLKISSRDERKDALPLPNGLLCLSGSHDGLLRCWDERGRCALTLAGHEKAVYTVCNLPDGRVASGGYDNSIRIWNLRTARCETVLRGHSDSIFMLRVFYHDRDAATRSASMIAAQSAINSSSPANLTSRHIPLFKLISSSSDKSVKVWNGVTYKCEQTLTGHTGSILSLVQLSDSLLATGSLDKTIRIWNIHTGKCELVLGGHLSSVSGLAVMDDNTRIASCSYDETIKIWQVQVPNSNVTFNPDGSVASTGGSSASSSASGDVNAVAHFQLEKSIRGHTSAIMNILHLPATGSSPQRLVTCSRDLNIKVWLCPNDPNNGGIGALRCISIFTSHRNDINNLCVLSDQRTLVSCSSDCMIKTFDLEKNGNVTISELSITNTNQDGKGYTVYSVCPLPDSRRTLKKVHQGVAVEEWDLQGGKPPAGAAASAASSKAATPVRRPLPVAKNPLAAGQNGLPAGSQPSPLTLDELVPGNNAQPPVMKPIVRINSGNGLTDTAQSSTSDDTASPTMDTNAREKADLSGDDEFFDEEERAAKPLILKPDSELDPALRRVIQKYRLKHYLPCEYLIDDGFYDDGGVVFVTTSHVPRSSAAQVQQQAIAQQMANKSAMPKISLNNRLSYASPVLNQPAASQSPQAMVSTIAQPSNNPVSAPSSIASTNTSLASTSSTTLSSTTSSTSSSPFEASRFRPYKQWSEEIIVLDARFDQNLRSTVEEARRLLAGVADVKARIIMLALFVSNKLGGSPKDIVKNWQTTMSKLKRVYGRSSSTSGSATPNASTSQTTDRRGRLVLPIGSLIGRVGLSRHRALLFKYLCDQTVLFPENWAPPMQRSAANPHIRASPSPTQPASPSPLSSPHADKSASTAAIAAAAAAVASSGIAPAGHAPSVGAATSSVGGGVDGTFPAQVGGTEPTRHAHPPPAGHHPHAQSAEQLYSTGNPHPTSDDKISSPLPILIASHLTAISSTGDSSSLRSDGSPAVSLRSFLNEGADAEVERTNSTRSRSASGDASSQVESPRENPAEPTQTHPQASQVHSPVTQTVTTADEASPSDVVYPSIHCRLMRGQYEYHFPRSALRAKSQRRTQRTWEESWEDQEAGYSRHQDTAGSSKTFHAWAVVELQGQQYVVDLSYEPSQLYLESSKEAAHYNRGRLGDVKKTGLTSAPLRSLHEIKWHELTDLSLLRDGGFGRVEKAKYRGLEVVVKTPLSLDSYILRTFMEEAQVLNLLSHPNIVKLVGVCTEKKAIVLDFVQGGDLHTFIKNQAALKQQYQEALKQQELNPTNPSPVILSTYQPLTMLDRLDMLIQMAIGMMYLHWCEPMITHRDLKSANVLVSTVKYNPDELSPPSSNPNAAPSSVVSRRILKICDFGLARNQHHDDGISTQHKDVGTPAFQSPEQWRDDEEERLTTATDVYSFGGIMIETLTDRMPWFNEKSKYSIYQHVMVDKRLPPIPADEPLHPKLIDCIHACHQFEPAARPGIPEVLRVLREVGDEIEAQQRAAAANQQ